MHIALRQICVPVDFSKQAEHALSYGVTFAKQFQGRLHLLHVVQDILPTVPEPGLAILPTEEILKNLEQGATEGLERLKSQFADAGIEIVCAVRHGVPFHEICQYAKRESIDLLVLGTHGRTGLAHFLLGSVVERVVRSSPCPVLSVRHPEHEFVVPD